MENKIELLGVYGNDLSHAMSAWTSTSRDLNEDKLNRVPALLNMLASAGHHTPFEKSSIHFLVTADIASHIHCLKHRIGVSCVTGDTLISIPRPTVKGQNSSGAIYKTIAQLYEEYNFGISSKSSKGGVYRRKYGRKTPVRSADHDGFIVKAYINNVFLNGVKPVFEFETEDGQKIKTTLDHRFLTPEGFKEIGKYLGVCLENGTALYTNTENLVAVNGVETNVTDRPWTFKEFFSGSEEFTRKSFSTTKKISYELCKKWGHIHNAIFKEDLNKNFKKKNIPWNYHKYGYKLNRARNGISTKINPSLSKKSWRATVGNWTREQLPILLDKYNHICQHQGSDECSRDFVCHHVIPVSVDKDRATDINNLVLVCRNCHKNIHKSKENEIRFAEMFFNDFTVKTIFLNRSPRVGAKLKVHYKKITKVRFVGNEEVFDLEVEGLHNYVANGFLIHNCNAESARYKELKDDKYYIPTDWPKEEKDRLETFVLKSFEEYHSCIERLVKSGVPRKRAKESARYYLTYANQITFDIMFNFRSFMHFLGLRNKPDAQVEIHEIASKMLGLVKENGSFHDSLIAFGY